MELTTAARYGPHISNWRLWLRRRNTHHCIRPVQREEKHLLRNYLKQHQTGHLEVTWLLTWERTGKRRVKRHWLVNAKGCDDRLLCFYLFLTPKTAEIPTLTETWWFSRFRLWHCLLAANHITNVAVELHRRTGAGSRSPRGLCTSGYVQLSRSVVRLRQLITEMEQL